MLGQLGTQDEVAAAIDGDPRLAAWQVRRSGAGWIELETRRDLARIKAPLLLVLAWPEVWRDPVAVRPHLLRARSGNYALMLVGNDEEFTAAGALALADDADVAALAVPASVERVALALRARAEGSALRQIAAGLELELAQAQHENRLLIETGRALSQQRDMGSLLEIILRQARDVTGADAGSVYIVLGDDDATERTLRFMVSQNDSRRIDSKGFTMAVSGSSIVGTCVLSSDVINIPDLYQLDAPGAGNNPWGFVHDRSFDDKYRYQTRSMLTVPMISARHQVIGVIQLINKRARGTIMLETPDDFAERVVTRVRASEARKPKESRPYEVRLTPEEAAAGCVLPIRLESGVTVDVTFPAGSPDGHLSTCAFGGEEIKILVRVITSQKKRPARSGRSAPKTQPPALPPPNAN